MRKKMLVALAAITGLIVGLWIASLAYSPAVLWENALFDIIIHSVLLLVPLSIAAYIGFHAWGFIGLMLVDESQGEDAQFSASMTFIVIAFVSGLIFHCWFTASRLEMTEVDVSFADEPISYLLAQTKLMRVPPNTKASELNAVLPVFTVKRRIDELQTKGRGKIGVYFGPGTYYGKIADLDNAEPIWVTGEVEGKNWYQVEYGQSKIKAYVHESLLETLEKNETGSAAVGKKRDVPIIPPRSAPTPVAAQTTKVAPKNVSAGKPKVFITCYTTDSEIDPRNPRKSASDIKTHIDTMRNKKIKEKGLKHINALTYFIGAAPYERLETHYTGSRNWRTLYLSVKQIDFMRGYHTKKECNETFDRYASIDRLLEVWVSRVTAYRIKSGWEKNILKIGE